MKFTGEIADPPIIDHRSVPKTILVSYNLSARYRFKNSNQFWDINMRNFLQRRCDIFIMPLGSFLMSNNSSERAVHIQELCTMKSDKIRVQIEPESQTISLQHVAFVCGFNELIENY